jgi:peptide/nickel transport system substrate-binding protein
MCINRQQVIDTVLYGLSSIPVSYVPEGYPLYNPNVPPYTFNVAAANALLEQAGWRDLDHDPSTPRQGWGIPNVPTGTPFEVTYVTTSAIQRQQVSSILVASLAQCGIKVDVQYVDQGTLYAPGPAGLLFGRAYDMVEFAMGSTGSDAYRQSQAIFAQDLPVIPLYWRLKVAAARPDMCNVALDPTAASALWNIENIDAGAGCHQ